MPRGVPKDPAKTAAKRGEANTHGSIKAASMSFREMLNDGGLRPSTLLLMRMRNDPRGMDPGDPECKHEFGFDRGNRGKHCALCGAETKVGMPERVAIADKAIQYELPRLAAIEAEVEHVGKSHEEWVREFATTDEPEEEHTIQ